MVDHRDILISDDVIGEPERVRRTLARRVDELLRQGGDGVSDLHVLRLVVHLPATDPHAWLREQQLHPKIFWHGRQDEVVTAAVGSADRVYGGPGADYDALRSQLDLVLPKSDARVRYFGGFRFDLTAETDESWREFGTFSFTLPRFVYMRRGDRAILACNLLLPRDVVRRRDILLDVENLQFPDQPLSADLPTPVSRVDEPDRRGWTSNVEQALEAFREGTAGLEKIVLARRAAFGFAEALDPAVVLKHLVSATTNCFHFGFQLSDRSAFIGATPERLFRRSGRRIWTEAVAGTRPRGATEVEDRRAVASLLASEKEQREHAFVRESIRASLAPLCTQFHIDSEASELKLARGWHLVSRSRALLKEGIHGSEVMRALHPTPAVGGHPTAPALAEIRALEPFDRGWYAGPVGWIGSHGAEFAVALRCGLVRGTTLSLYSGAGIVDGSDASAEWAEIEQKLADFLKIFGLGRREGA